MATKLALHIDAGAPRPQGPQGGAVMSRPLVVTRHPALLELLLERGLLRAPYDHLTHAAAADVRGRDVIGVLPEFQRIGMDAP